MEIAHQQVRVPPPKLGGLFRKTNLGLEDVIARCLEKEPGRRFQDYSSLVEAVLSIAKRRSFRVADFCPGLRYERPVLGRDEFRAKLDRVKTTGQGYAELAWEEIEPHLDEAQALCALGEFGKAARILEPLFTEELCRRTTAWSFCHRIAVNYADCLCQSGDAARAIHVFETVAVAEPKSPEYFINFSIALIHARDAAGAERIAKQGLAAFRDDKDMLGNLMLAQRLNEKLDDALETSRRLLSVCRDFHALEDVACLLRDLAHREGENWPGVVKHLKNALHLLDEARHLNPRYALARFVRAQVLHELGHYADSNNECAEVFNLSDNHSLREAAVCLRAEIYSDVSAYKECLEFCNEWIPKLKIPHLLEDLERTRAKLNVDRMIGQEKDGRRGSVPSAVQFFKRKVENNPNALLEDALYYARICEWISSSETCFDVLKWIEAKKPGWWKIHYFRAEFLFRRGKHDEAILEIQRAVAAAPYHPGPLFELADYHERLGNTSEAERRRKEAAAVSARRKELSRIQH